MQSAQQILNGSRLSSASSLPTRSGAEPLPVAMSSTLNLTEPTPRMQELWQRMCRRFGSSRWTGQYGEADNGTWDAALDVFSDQALANAIDRIVARGGEFMPGLPDLVAICLRTSGLPDPVVAYHSATQYRWGHPVIYETAKRIGFYRMRNGTEAQTLPSWRETFGLVCIEFLRGNAKWIQRAVDRSTKAIADNRRKSERSSPETAAQHIAYIRARCGFSQGSSNPEAV